MIRRSVVLLLLTIGAVPLCAQIGSSHERLMERAHPTPEEHPMYEGLEWNPPFIVDKVFPSLFLNVSTTIDGNDQSPTQNESSIAIDPLDPRRLIASAVDYRGASSTWVYASSDGGRTWTNTNLGYARPEWQSTNDPSVAFDRSGHGYLCYGGFNRTKPALGENGIFCSVTTDGGMTWSKKHIPVIQHLGQQTKDSAFEDKYYVHPDTVTGSPFHDRVYVPWKRVINRDSSTQIVISHSTDHGSTWSAPVAVSTRMSGISEDTTYGQSFPLARTGPDGNVHVVWNSGTERAIRYAVSTDGGATFSPPRILHRYTPYAVATTIDSTTNHRLKGTVRAETYPTLSIDNTNGPRRGWMYLSWSADGVPNVYASRSTDGGQTWSTPVIVHSDTTNDQFWPWICVDPSNGDVAVMYADSRDDAANILVNTYVSFSTNGGATWIDRRVGDDLNDIRRNPFKGVFSGDYSGCDMLNGMLYPSWVDMRNTYTSPADNDVYTAVINVRAPEAPGTFAAIADPIDATTILLRWSAVTKRSFGQPLDPSALTYVLYRGNVQIASLPGTTTSFVDAGRTPYTEYRYTLVAIATGDTSSPRQASATSGGARQPAPPVLHSCTNATTNVIGSITLPTVRADSLTPLSDLAAVVWYSDSMEIGVHAVAASDTGATLSIDQIFPRGWHLISVAARTSKGQTSARSNAIRLYVGSYDLYTEHFDSVPRFWIQRGTWGRTSSFAKSAPASFTESPAGPYRSTARDTVIIYPVVIGGATAARLSFWHAAFVDPSDTAFVEYTLNSIGNAWTTFGAYNSASYARWADTSKGDDAWRYEARTILPQHATDTLYVRLRFRSNATRQSDGWYVDDVMFEAASSVTEATTTQHRVVYPQPASSFATVGLAEGEDVSDVVVTGLTADALPCPWYQEGTSLVLDMHALPAGVYLLRATALRGTFSTIITVCK